MAFRDPVLNEMIRSYDGPHGDPFRNGFIKASVDLLCAIKIVSNEIRQWWNWLVDVSRWSMIETLDMRRLGYGP
jgi:hypothetical protein